MSVATVSRYRRGSRRFASVLEARIDAAVAALGYRDNRLARGLVTGRTGAVGLVVLDLANPHFSSLVQGAQRVAAQHQLSLAFVDTAESQAPERQLVEALAQRVDGLVVSARLAGGALDWITRLGKPVVFFGHGGLAGWHSVGTDGHAAALLLGRHLAERGHRQLTYLDFAASRWSAERLRGLREALAEVGGEVTAHAVASPGAEAGEAAAAAVLLAPRGGTAARRPDAVVAYNDLVAVGFMHEAQRLGVAVPGEVAVAGFDDIEWARHVSPALTSMAMNSQAMGAVAMQRLLQLMAGELPLPFDETLPPRLMVRESSAAPSRRSPPAAPVCGAALP